MGKKVIDIEFNGIDLKCYGNYFSGRSETREQPEEPAEFEIDQITYNGVDVTSLVNAIDEECNVELERLCLEKML